MRAWVLAVWGDVLTGVIAGFISQGYSLQDSAVLGVYVHSRSADILNETKSWGYTRVMSVLL